MRAANAYVLGPCAIRSVCSPLRRRAGIIGKEQRELRQRQTCQDQHKCQIDLLHLGHGLGLRQHYRPINGHGDRVLEVRAQ
jgi:hypothetical protein